MAILLCARRPTVGLFVKSVRERVARHVRRRDFAGFANDRPHALCGDDVVGEVDDGEVRQICHRGEDSVDGVDARDALRGTDLVEGERVELHALVELARLGGDEDWHALL